MNLAEAGVRAAAVCSSHGIDAPGGFGGTGGIQGAVSQSELQIMGEEGGGMAGDVIPFLEGV